LCSSIAYCQGWKTNPVRGLTIAQNIELSHSRIRLSS
jgi:hypothetical protein